MTFSPEKTPHRIFTWSYNLARKKNHCTHCIKLFLNRRQKLTLIITYIVIIYIKFAALKIHCSSDCKVILDQVGGYVIDERGLVAMKGKGEMMTYWVTDQDPSYRRNRPHQLDSDSENKDTESIISDKHKIKKSPGKSYLRTPLGSTYETPSTSNPSTDLKATRSVQDVSSTGVREDPVLMHSSDIITTRRSSDGSRTDNPRNGKNGYTLLSMDCDDALPSAKSDEVEIRTTDFGDGNGDTSSQARSVSACSLNRCDGLDVDTTMNGALSQRPRNNSQGSRTKTKKNSTADSGIGSNGNSSRDCYMHNEIFLWSSRGPHFLLFLWCLYAKNIEQTLWVSCENNCH